ncbi:GNAT family N-acetyltransferase [Phototrophicus methaneseepsis]|uniref:GNAT family N-acetyltransferase n=1 Tax=Phototrophicus methaneseepsis TaxID=2710758 RepID=A0A7S8E5B1_9CHLR|nr:GNAT family N-acetyltransferase [Phototrophicus methaneseepsis]QPC80646.1 GNAT family N-acetyltransferase [Phototrophicus methaneseepsis]
MSEKPKVPIIDFQPAHMDACVHIMLTNELWQAYGMNSAKAEAFFHSCYTDATATLLVALVDAQPVGFICYYKHGTLYSGGYIRSIGVDPYHQGYGVGEQLMDAAEADIAYHTHDVFLLSSDFNTRAHTFYQRRGYQSIGPLADYIKRGITEIIFWKRFIREGSTG